MVHPTAQYNQPMGTTIMRIVAVTLTVLFPALLVWLYGVKTSLIWAAAMAAFLALLYLATMPLRARQRRLWGEYVRALNGRPYSEEAEEEEDDPAEADDEFH
jgi:CBS domain containing-hemolysin-like protein